MFPSSRGEVIALLSEDRLTKSALAGDVCGIVLDRTCFYHESGGQAADRGTLTSEVSGDSVCLIFTARWELSR